MTRRPQIAVFGGSFDPPHIGHVLLAHYALAVTHIIEVIVAPTYAHAFGKPLTAFNARVAMAKLAFSDLRRVRVDPIEQALGGTSRTLRLVEALAARHPDSDLRLLIGADILLEAGRFQRFDEVRAKAPLIVAGRGGFQHPDVDPNAPILPEISSSHIREALARGEDVGTQVPSRVLAYIREHGLYGAEPVL